MAKISIYERMAASPLVATVHHAEPNGVITIHRADFYHENGLVVRLDGTTWTVVRGPGAKHLVQRDGSEVTEVWLQRKMPAGHLPSRIRLPNDTAATELFMV